MCMRIRICVSPPEGRIAVVVAVSANAIASNDGGNWKLKTRAVGRVASDSRGNWTNCRP